MKYDVSQRLAMVLPSSADSITPPISYCWYHKSCNRKAPGQKIRPANTNVVQNYFGDRAAPQLLASFDGLGEDFEGPQGKAIMRNPSDNSLAVGPDHIVQIVNARMAIFTKKGARFDVICKVLYGPGETRNVFKGFGGPCEKINNGDAVVRYDQLANRWLIVMPNFTRARSRHNSTVKLNVNLFRQGTYALDRDYRWMEVRPWMDVREITAGSCAS